MSVEKNSNKGAGGGRVRSRWQLDFSSRSSHGMELLSPPGYTAGENRRKFNQKQSFWREYFQVKAPSLGRRSPGRLTLIWRSSEAGTWRWGPSSRCRWTYSSCGCPATPSQSSRSWWSSWWCSDPSRPSSLSARHSKPSRCPGLGSTSWVRK